MKISKREMLGGVVGTTVAAAGAGRAVAQAMPAIAHRAVPADDDIAQRL